MVSPDLRWKKIVDLEALLNKGDTIVVPDTSILANAYYFTSKRSNKISKKKGHKFGGTDNSLKIMKMLKEESVPNHLFVVPECVMAQTKALLEYSLKGASKFDLVDWYLAVRKNKNAKVLIMTDPFVYRKHDPEKFEEFENELPPAFLDLTSSINIRPDASKKEIKSKLIDKGIIYTTAHIYNSLPTYNIILASNDRKHINTAAVQNAFNKIRMQHSFKLKRSGKSAGKIKLYKSSNLLKEIKKK